METVKDYMLYKEKVLEDFSRVHRFFPFLNLSFFPTTYPTEAVFKGYIVRPEMNKIVNQAVLEKYGLKVLGIYPFDFPQEPIRIYDFDKKISWDKIPSEHWHINPDGSLCTHHPLGEINSIPNTDRTVAMLISAWQLYLQVKACVEEGKKWTLKDLPHGSQAIKILRKEGRL